MSEQPFERLAYKNRFVKELRQDLEGVDCFTPFASLNPEDNLIVLKLSEAQFVRMYSAILTGADITYPDESMQIQADFLKGLHCPPELTPEECYNLPTYANNIGYYPANPYIEPDTIPDGYLAQPFLVNGQNGNDFPDYEPFDVIVPFGAITFDLNFFEDIAGQLPTIEIMVNGAGSVNIRFLTSVQGGLAVVTLDNPPNLLDILSGIVTGSENIVDLNQDLVSLPPETAKEIIFPVNIETTGIHTVYVVFLPILDDSLIPLRFGGGFRGLEVCGFLPEESMGIQNLRFVGCDLEQQNADGSWSVVTGWEDWLDCVPSGGGGGGAMSIAAETKNVPLASNVTITSTTFTRISAGAWTRTFTKANALIQLVMTAQNSGANDTIVRPHIQQGVSSINGDSLTQGVSSGASPREIVVSDVFTGIELASAVLEIEWKVAAGTGTILNNYDVMWTVIEFDDVSELFVEDIRITGNELQKKIGGVWITVTDSLAAILSSITAIANNAAAAAAAAQSTANNALTIANGAVTVNNAQNTRLNNLENDVEDIMTIDIPQINLTLADHDARIDALELESQEVWSFVYDFTTGQHGWTASSSTYVSGQGFQSSSGVGFQVSWSGGTPVHDQRITHVKMEFSAVTGGGGVQDTTVVFFALGSQGNIGLSSAGSTIQWIKVDTSANPFNPIIAIAATTGTYYLRKITILGRGTNVTFF